MFQLTECDDNLFYRTLPLNEELFHNAMRYYLKGEKRFHVNAPDGSRFDLLYAENNLAIATQGLRSDKLRIPPYYSYDEKLTEFLCPEAFDRYRAVCFYEVDEYTVVLTKLLLQHTEKEVYAADSRILWFVQPRDRLHVSDAEPVPEDPQVLYVSMKFPLKPHPAANRCNQAGLFHDVFFLQWIADKPAGQIKYVLLSIGREEGIGSILKLFTTIRAGLRKYGLETYLDKSGTRYTPGIWNRCFAIPDPPADMTEENTVQIVSIYAMIRSVIVMNHEADLDYDLFRKEFLEEVAEYADAVLDPDRTLGVLMRGTDYITSGLGGKNGPREQAGPLAMAKTIRQLMKTGNYDRIFLATEDKAILTMMKALFPGKIRVIAQERHTVEEVQEVKFLNRLEEQLATGRRYEESLEDTTVNYLYALLILSRCAGLVSSGVTSGLEIVQALNRGKFRDFIITSASGK